MNKKKNWNMNSPLGVLAFIKENPGIIDNRFKNYLLSENYIEEVDDEFTQITSDGEKILKEFGDD